MKLLGYVNDEAEATRVLGLLETKGIPTFRKWAGWRGIPAYRVAVFVCLDQQYPDALALMSDPDHVVANPVDVKEYDRLAEAMGHAKVLKGALIALAIAVLVFVAFVLVFDLRLGLDRIDRDPWRQRPPSTANASNRAMTSATLIKSITPGNSTRLPHGSALAGLPRKVRAASS